MLGRRIVHQVRASFHPENHSSIRSKKFWTPSFIHAYNGGLGQVAQLVEQRIENPRVGGSIPPLATKEFLSIDAHLAVGVLLCAPDTRISVVRVSGPSPVPSRIARSVAHPTQLPTARTLSRNTRAHARATPPSLRRAPDQQMHATAPAFALRHATFPHVMRSWERPAKGTSQRNESR